MKNFLFLTFLVIMVTSCRSGKKIGNIPDKNFQIQDCKPIPEGSIFLNNADLVTLTKNNLRSQVEFYLSEVLITLDKKIPGWEKESNNLRVVDGVVVQEQKILRKNEVIIDGEQVPNIPFTFLKSVGNTIYLEATPGYGFDGLEVIADMSPDRNFYTVRGDSGGRCNKIYYFFRRDKKVEIIE